MSDTLTYLGEDTIAVWLPGVIGPLIAAQADLQARITALLGFSATVGLDLSHLITLSANILANLQAGLALGLQAPSLTVQINLVASLTLALQLQLQLILDLFGLLANAGVHAYAYDGTAAGFGPEATAAMAAGLPGGGGPTQHINALVLATSIGATWTAMSAVFRVTP